MSNCSEHDLSPIITKRIAVFVMKSAQFYNLIICFFILKFLQNILTAGQLLVGTRPENYKLLFNFSGVNNCSVNKCIYTGEAVITMTVAGRANSFFLQSDPETSIDNETTRLFRIYQNGTRMDARITGYFFTRGETSSIIEIQVEQMFRIMSESQYELTIHFSREFKDHRGFYNPNINPRRDNILMVTNLVPNRAHRLFPCMRNQHKWISSFELTVIHPSNYEIVTGIKSIEKQKVSENTNISIYEKTEKMPSEHLFFVLWRYIVHVVGPLTFWFPPDVDQREFSLMAEYTIKCLRYMSNMTGTVAPVHPFMNVAPISGSRIMDYYTVPGVSLYKEQRVLFNNTESSTTDRLDLLTLICRAVSSLWIGILIYPESRSELWIYRALAHYVADFMIDLIEPKFRNKELALARTILWTRSDRDLEASTTIPFYLFDTWDERIYFQREDYICYQTMTIIAMIHEIYNFEDVGSLITQSLMRWANGDFGPTKIEMVGSLERENVGQMIEDWSEIPGIPIVHVALDKSEQQAELVQERFNPSGPWSDDEFLWMIPIRCFDVATNEHYIEWLEPNVTFTSTAEHIRHCLLYTDTVVPYRVNYPEKWWLEIISMLTQNPRELGEMQRMKIIDDMLEFCLAGYIHMRVLFQLLHYLAHEVDYLPWLAAAKAFTKLRAIMATSDVQEYQLSYKRLGLKLIHNVYESLEENMDELPDHYLRLHRKNIANLACGFGHETCLHDAKNRLNCFIHELSNANCSDGYCYDYWGKCVRDADERDIILCQGLRRAPEEIWFRALQLLNITNLFPSVHLNIACGLACTENTDILENYINYVLHNSEMFPSDHIFPILLTAARLNEINAQVILHFIVKNHGKLAERLELPHEYHKHLYSLSEDMLYSNARNEGINLQGSPLTYNELPDAVQKILQINSVRAGKLRPSIEDYLDEYRKTMET